MRPADRNERLNAAVAEAAERLRAAEQRASSRAGPAAPGDVYALSGLGQDDLGWLVALTHPDRADQVFAVPLDDNPLCGTPDVPLPQDRVARCGEGVWLSVGLLSGGRRVDVLPGDLVRAVRAGVAALATGDLVNDPERRAADDDPSYQHWMRRVERARRRLERRADALGTVLPFALFGDEPPAYASAAPLALAAKTGGLAQEMEASDRDADAGVRHKLIAWAGGKLRLAASDFGLVLVWEGGEAARPTVLVRGEDQRFSEVAWKTPNPPLSVTPLLPWVGGRIVLRVGEETLTIPR